VSHLGRDLTQDLEGVGKLTLLMIDIINSDLPAPSTAK
jgi:hypothetical protein